LLPRSLREAIDALRADTFFRNRMGAQFIDYYLHIKEAEIARFEQDVSEWEHHEYFEMF
jgi:glutamine synthetase